MTNEFENQLDRIRVDLYEQTKNMTNSEVVRVTNENAKKIAEQYGIKIAKEKFTPPKASALCKRK